MKKLKIIFFILSFNILSLNYLSSDEVINDYPPDNPENKEDAVPNKSRRHLFFGKIGYSFPGAYNINTGLDFVFFHSRRFDDWEWLGFPEHIIGINYKYQFTGKDSIIRLDYTYVPFLFFTFGLSGSYNISKQEFGIAPKTGIQLFLQIFMLDIDYRYNIVVNNRDKNFYEMVLSFSVPLFLFCTF